MGSKQVDRQRRVDEVMYFLVDTPSAYVRYEGRTPKFFTPTADADWQIKRIIQMGDIREVSFAQVGNYNCIWDARVSYFPPPPPFTDPLDVLEVDIYPGEPVFLDYFAATASGAEITAIASTVAADKNRYLHSLVVDCGCEARAVVYADSVPVGSARTGPGGLLATFEWKPFRRVDPGTLIEVKIRLRSGAPSTDVGVWLQVSDA